MSIRICFASAISAKPMLAVVHYFVIKTFQLNVTKAINAFSVPKFFEHFMKISSNIFCDVFNNFFWSSFRAIFWKAVNMRLYYFLQIRKS